jgi:galactokinase/mevalonate kinase-like predicted kinase
MYIYIYVYINIYIYIYVYTYPLEGIVECDTLRDNAEGVVMRGRGVVAGRAITNLSLYSSSSSSTYVRASSSSRSGTRPNEVQSISSATTGSGIGSSSSSSSSSSSEIKNSMDLPCESAVWVSSWCEGKLWVPLLFLLMWDEVYFCIIVVVYVYV